MCAHHHSHPSKIHPQSHVASNINTIWKSHIIRVKCTGKANRNALWIAKANPGTAHRQADEFEKYCHRLQQVLLTGTSHYEQISLFECFFQSEGTVMISCECILPGATLGFSIRCPAPLPSPDHSAAGSAATSYPSYIRPLEIYSAPWPVVYCGTKWHLITILKHTLNYLESANYSIISLFHYHVIICCRK